ncbi:hypothetical protein [uncultured Winogradskyella sp.]|uniref:hypothetical protein n=1 Tax=uncultured Winogradskyella sp. TaxID=395353 RepID=UPI002606D074|nr:hypothetical protein [uncultured Winogradskyella sp.]
MLKINGKAILCTIILLISLLSCVKDVDFDQANDFSLTPALEASIVYTEVEASQFSLNGVEIEIIRDSIANIEIFEEQFVKDNLIRAEFIFEATNTIPRTFNLQVDFLNNTDELQHTVSFDALASSAGNEVVTEYIEIFEDDSLENLKLVTKMIITLTLYPSSDGSMLNENSSEKISLKSKGIFYFDIDV